MSSGGVGSKTMSGIKQSQARGSTTNDTDRRALEEPCNAREHPGTVAAARTVALPFVFALFLSCGFAQESPKHPEEDHNLTFGGETDFTSGYVWRGLLLDDGPIMQPSAWISKSGFTFAAWTSHPLSKTSESTHLNASTLTLTYGRDWKKLTIEPSVESYFNRRAEDSNDPNTMEGSLKLSYSAGPLRVFTIHAFDVLTYRGAYFGEAGLGYERHVTKNAELSISSFDLSVEEVWLAFHAGTTLVAATPGMAHAGPDLSQLLTECGVTVLSSVPTLLAILKEDVPTLRLLILGGEACPDRVVARWPRPGRRVVNTYGPTETTVIATNTDLSPGKPVTIGRAVPGYRVHLLDDGLRPVPRGQVGEICVGGAGVARGYVGLPERTRERFVPDPFAPDGEVDARIYRTGDLGRFDTDGNIEFLGRRDAQVKLRGFRIELAEIESVLMQSDGILAAACAVREDVPGVQQLVGYVVPSDGKPVDEKRLRSQLRDRLPAYMTPGLIETVTDLPRFPSGQTRRGPGSRQSGGAGPCAKRNYASRNAPSAKRRPTSVRPRLRRPTPRRRSSRSPMAWACAKDHELT